VAVTRHWHGLKFLAVCLSFLAALVLTAAGLASPAGATTSSGAGTSPTYSRPGNVVRTLASCASSANRYGTITVCPRAAPVGATVTVYVTKCDGATIVFLGTLAYIGSGGGGDVVVGRVPRGPHGVFQSSFRVPATYLTGGNVNTAVPVARGGGYHLGSYPANECSVAFDVTGPAGTVTDLYQPFTGDRVDASLHVVAHYSGSCTEYQGPVDNRVDYRCFTAQVKRATVSWVFDPCFAAPSKSVAATLVCPTNPATNRVVEVAAKSIGEGSLTRLRALQPWAVQLANGQICQLVDAAWGGLGPYSCLGKALSGAPLLADCHMPAPTRPFWTAPCQQRLTLASPFKATALKAAWF
jgi:hypothetical protein